MPGPGSTQMSRPGLWNVELCNEVSFRPKQGNFLSNEMS